MSWILAVCHPRAGPQHVGAGNSVPENFEILSLAHGSKRGRKYLSFQNNLLEYNFLALKLMIFDRYVATWNMHLCHVMGDMLLNKYAKQKSMQKSACQVAHGPVLAGPMPSSCTKKRDFSWNLKPKKQQNGFFAPNPDQKSRISRIKIKYFSSWDVTVVLLLD